jgi:hypothetical protein
MSNLHSNRVVSGKIKRLVPCINIGETIVDDKRMEKQFDLLKLINVLAVGVGKWIETYNSDRQKIEKFVERYDTVVSDARVAYRPLSDGNK